MSARTIISHKPSRCYRPTPGRDATRRVAEGGVTDDVVPMFQGDLAGDDGRCATMAIIKELEKVAPFGRIENRQAPVVEDEELNATDGFEQAAIAAIASSEGERLEEARDAMILD